MPRQSVRLEECRLEHRAVRQVVQVTVSGKAVSFVQCRLCDRGRCPTCWCVLSDGTAAYCPVCRATLAIAAP